jgi:hypothetical protein
VIHPVKPIVAYSCGCIIIVHNLFTDEKLQLSDQQHEIRSLKFSAAGAGSLQTEGDYLISIDYNTQTNQASIKIWNWSSGICIQTAPLPSSSILLESEKKFNCGFDHSGTLFCVLETTLTSYRASVWTFNRQLGMNFVHTHDLDR